MTIRELAAFLSVRLPTAYGLVWDGTIKATKINGEWTIDRNSAEAYQAQRSARRQRIRKSQSRRQRTIDVQPVVVSV